MELFEIREKRVYPTVHVLLLEPFKTIWERDISVDKIEAMKDFSYIEFMCNPKKSNPYIDYPAEIREEKIKDIIYGDATYEVDYLIVEAIEFYRNCFKESMGYRLLDTALIAAEKQRKFLNDFEPNSRTPTGSLLLKPKEVFVALKEIPDTIKAINIARSKVHIELITEEIKTRNQREINIYEK